MQCGVFAWYAAMEYDCSPNVFEEAQCLSVPFRLSSVFITYKRVTNQNTSKPYTSIFLRSGLLRSTAKPTEKCLCDMIRTRVHSHLIGHSIHSRTYISSENCSFCTLNMSRPKDSSRQVGAAFLFFFVFFSNRGCYKSKR